MWFNVYLYILYISKKNVHAKVYDREEKRNAYATGMQFSFHKNSWNVIKKKKDICECILVETLKYLQCAYCKLSTIPAY